jgi:surface antigen
VDKLELGDFPHEIYATAGAYKTAEERDRDDRTRHRTGVMTELDRQRPWRRGGPRSGQGEGGRLALRVALACLLLAAAAQRVSAQDADEEYLGPLINQALESQRTGVEVPWSNPATGSSGTIVVERTFYRDPRTPCRDYRRTIERAGGPAVAIEGTACRIGAGRWSLDEQEPEPTREARSRSAPREPEAAAPPEAESAAAPPSCPPPSAAPACEAPAKVVDYTMPARTEL